MVSAAAGQCVTRCGKDIAAVEVRRNCLRTCRSSGPITKAPGDLASHFHWHGDVFTDGQVIDTITPRDQRGTAAKSSDPKVKAEPIWDPSVHVKSWRAVWAYSTK